YLNNSTFTTTGTAQNISLRAGEYHVFTNRNVNNLATTPVSNLPWSEATLAVRAYPNPVFSFFTVEVNLMQNSIVSIELINTAGQRISMLHQAFMTKGKHQLILNRKTLPVPTGHYYLHMSTTAGDRTLSVTLE
ncbi:MAG: T9SS type A sorting domain-containing protein, partial [Flavisolibacter sp.]|nr:T9SS type A sorting domain-containing protein [Flavisolibacter sp.]